MQVEISSEPNIQKNFIDTNYYSNIPPEDNLIESQKNINNFEISNPVNGLIPTFSQTFGKDKETFHKTDKVFQDKVKEIIHDLNEIEKVLPFCENVSNREMLLDRGISLSQLLQDLCKSKGIDYNIFLEKEKYKLLEKLPINNPSVIYHTKKNKINPELINLNFWMNQKIDRYEKTEERKKIPREFWYHLKSAKFIGELGKCFELNRQSYQNNYNWLFKKENNF